MTAMNPSKGVEQRDPEAVLCQGPRVYCMAVFLSYLAAIALFCCIVLSVKIPDSDKSLDFLVQ